MMNLETDLTKLKKKRKKKFKKKDELHNLIISEVTASEDYDSIGKWSAPAHPFKGTR